MKRAVVIKMAEADQPVISDRQRSLCKRLISVGLSCVAITSIVLGKDAEKLTIAEQKAGARTIRSCINELGYGIVDARNARTKEMVRIVQDIAQECRIRVKIA